MSIDNDGPLRIGERINPSGRPGLQAALAAGDYSALVAEAVSQARQGAQALDVNVAMPGIDEPEALLRAVAQIQKAVSAPLVIDSANPEALEAALDAYKGCPILNSIPGRDADMMKLFPLAKKNNATVICMAIDERGVPKTAADRLIIARKLLSAALAHGLTKEDLFIDCVALPIAHQPEQRDEALRALERVKRELGLKTILGISNISYGLPNREAINAEFSVAALAAGLDAAIYNPAQESVARIIVGRGPQRQPTRSREEA